MKIYYTIIFFILIFFCLGNPTTQAQEKEIKILHEVEKTMTVYPIPARTFAHIRLSSSLQNEVERIQIINLIGRELASQTILDKSTTEITFNNLSDAPNGIYMVIARDQYGKIILSTKMIIDK